MAVDLSVYLFHIFCPDQVLNEYLQGCPKKLFCALNENETLHDLFYFVFSDTHNVLWPVEQMCVFLSVKYFDFNNLKVFSPKYQLHFRATIRNILRKTKSPVWCSSHPTLLLSSPPLFFFPSFLTHVCSHECWLTFPPNLLSWQPACVVKLFFLLLFPTAR